MRGFSRNPKSHEGNQERKRDSRVLSLIPSSMYPFSLRRDNKRFASSSAIREWDRVSMNCCVERCVLWGTLALLRFGSVPVISHSIALGQNSGSQSFWSLSCCMSGKKTYVVWGFDEPRKGIEPLTCTLRARFFLGYC